VSRNSEALINFIETREKWLDIAVPPDFKAQIVLRIEMFERWKSLFMRLLKYATAETILILFLKCLAM
jgi:hypothetical protein